MRIGRIEIYPVRQSINPELIFEIEMFINRYHEVPILITGVLYKFIK